MVRILAVKRLYSANTTQLLMILEKVFQRVNFGISLPPFVVKVFGKCMIFVCFHIIYDAFFSVKMFVY